MKFFEKCFLFLFTFVVVAQANIPSLTSSYDLRSSEDGARYYDPRTSVWQSPDPILGEYMSGQTNGGVFNSKNLGLFSYTYNNPVNLVDPDGRSTWINDKGDVTKVNTQDNDFSIYQHVPDRHYGPPNKVGETHFMDAFVAYDQNGKKLGDKGHINLNYSIDGYMSKMESEADELGTVQTFMESKSNKTFDVKTQHPLSKQKAGGYEGALYKGKYVTLREAGNILAGRNAAASSFGSFDRWQKGFGALHKKEGIGGAIKAFLTGNSNYPAPNYGEIDYQRTRSEWGYDNYMEENPIGVPDFGVMP